MFARALPAVAAVCLLAPGCGPATLNENRTLSLDAEYPAKGIDLGAQSKPQTLTVEFESSGPEVSVYVFKEADAKGDDGLQTADAKKALGQKKGKKDSFTADVPENTAARVVVRGTGEKADVKLKVTNKK